ncbi:hypothetical protein IU17_06950 [Mycobacterium tuberculosis]|nr:hypothetical protein IU17_06950 [Mycobacterium tuberculosis]
MLSLPADKTTTTSGDPQPQVTSSSVSTSAPGMLAGWQRDAVAAAIIRVGRSAYYNPVGSVLAGQHPAGSGSGHVVPLIAAV